MSRENVPENKKDGAPRNQSKRQMSFFLNKFIHSVSTWTRHLQRARVNKKNTCPQRNHSLGPGGAAGSKTPFMGAGQSSPVLEYVISIYETTPSPTKRRRKRKRKTGGERGLGKQLRL